MINLMHSMEMPLEKTLDPHLWQACAGGMTQIPPVNSKVYYFPQGHAEHASKNVDFNRFSRVPSLIPCRVSSIKHLADTETDDVYAKIRLVPIKENECDVDDEGGLGGLENSGEKERANSFAKTLTQSDANNGGGFSVPRYCAETIFPKLDYKAEPPVQTILVKDVHGEVWKFRHIYRGTPRRHLLTTGWSNFVNRKKLIAGDSVVFLRAENGDLCVGIRRSKTGIGCGPEVPSGWNTHGLYGFSSESAMKNFKNGNGNCDLGVKEKSNMRVESVIDAVSLAVSGQAFEVIYYPRASTPEFVVRASAVNAAMRVQWYPGMRFKMAFETEDSSRISWFMGTVSSVQVDDPVHWPNSPWRLLQVAWDEPDLLQNVKRVNPWLVELVSNIAAIHHFPYSPPPKRPRVPQPLEFPIPYSPLTKMPQVPQPPEFPMGHLPLLSNNHPLSPSSPLYCLPDNYVSAGIQGARHAQFMLSSSDLHFNHLQTGLRPFDFKPLSYACPLKMESSTQKNDDEKKPVFVLFGQPILTEQQISRSSSMDNGGNSLSDGNQENTGNVSHGSGSAVIQNSPPEASSDEEFQQ